MAQYGYIRVSTREQNIDRQLEALKPYQIPAKNVFCDYQSGKDFDRPAYQQLMKKLRPGDLLIIKSIDRLGRNYNEILVQWQRITKEIQADIAIALLLVTKYVLIPNRHYEEAISLMKLGDYENAKKAFGELDDYKDSKEKILECDDLIRDQQYDEAVELMNSGEYDKAITVLELLNSAC